jgi:hypothetical protein
MARSGHGATNACPAPFVTVLRRRAVGWWCAAIGVLGVLAVPFESGDADRTDVAAIGPDVGYRPPTEPASADSSRIAPTEPVAVSSPVVPLELGGATDLPAVDRTAPDLPVLRDLPPPVVPPVTSPPLTLPPVALPPGGELPVPAPLEVVVGRVVDTGGRPVPGLCVELMGVTVPQTTTAGDGTFRFLDLPDPMFPGGQLVAMAHSCGPWQEWTYETSGRCCGFWPGPAVLDLVVYRRATVLAEVVDDGGRGIPGLCVQLQSLHDLSVVERTTDILGRIAPIEGLPPYVMDITVRDGCDGPVVEALPQGFELPLPVGPRVHEIRLVVPAR